MSHKARSQRLSATTRWSSCAYDSKLFDSLPLEVSPIVVALLVDKLSQELNRWLGSVELLLRHVDIIDEDKALCIALDSAIDALALFLQLAIDIGLRALAIRLCGEVEFNRHNGVSIVCSHLLYEVLNHHGFACSSSSSHKDGLVNRSHHLKQSSSLLCIDCWDDKLEEWSRLGRILKLIQQQFFLVVDEFELL